MPIELHQRRRKLREVGFLTTGVTAALIGRAGALAACADGPLPLGGPWSALLAGCFFLLELGPALLVLYASRVAFSTNTGADFDMSSKRTTSTCHAAKQAETVSRAAAASPRNVIGRVPRSGRHRRYAYRRMPVRVDRAKEQGMLFPLRPKADSAAAHDAMRRLAELRFEGETSEL